MRRGGIVATTQQGGSGIEVANVEEASSTGTRRRASRTCPKCSDGRPWSSAGASVASALPSAPAAASSIAPPLSPSPAAATGAAWLNTSAGAAAGTANSPLARMPASR